MKLYLVNIINFRYLVNMYLSIVIPAYNEEQRITHTLDKYIDHFSDNNEVEYIIVLNGCTDNTLSVITGYKEKYPDNIRFLDIKEAIGKGAAIKEGFKIAKGELIGFLDADGSTSPSEYEKLIKHMPSYDGAIASRWKKGAIVTNRKMFRKIVSFCFIFIVRLLFWLPYSDTQCGAKIFKKDIIDKILPNLSVTNMAFDVQLLYLISKNRYQIIEVPTKWIDNNCSSILGSPFQVLIKGFAMLGTLLKIRFG